MTPSEIRAARECLGLSEVDFGRALRFDGDARKKARELENGARIASPQMIAIIEGSHTRTGVALRLRSWFWRAIRNDRRHIALD
jgi:hypothetical protein